jgi:hypothetical protein
MANSKLLKEAIADAKAVRETAIANAKIALEEAFTPRLQSILSRKLQAEMEGEEEETMEEEMDSMDLNLGDDEEQAAEVSNEEEEVTDVVEEEEMEMDSDEAMEEAEGSVEDPTNADDASISEEDEMGEDELDLESIIRELEMGMDSEEEEVTEEEEMEVPEMEIEEEEEVEAEPAMEEEEMESDDEIDLEEILREMGYGDDEEEVNEEEEVADNSAELEAELEEAYSVIKKLQSTINEVNLLNAKLLYANKLFRGYNLTNEQKGKVVENLDRTTSVREVKLVFATLSESMNFTGTERKAKRAIAESVASKPTRSTAPKKEIISENTNEMAARFKELANIK